MNQQLKNLYEASMTSPKLIKKGGEYTKKFLTWNLQQLKEGKTIYYADTTKLYNPITKRIIKRVFDKRSKVVKETKSFNAKFPNRQGSTIIKREGDYEEFYDPELWDETEGSYAFPNSLNEGEYLNEDEYIPNKLLDNFQGESVRVVIKFYEIDDRLEDPLYTSIFKDVSSGTIYDWITKRKNNPGHSGDYNYIINKIYNVPKPPSKFKNKIQSDYWRTLYKNKIKYDFWVNSDFRNIIACLLHNQIGCRLIITRQINITPVEIYQSFANGASHCVLQPIDNWINASMDKASTKKAKSRYVTFRNKLHTYTQKSGIEKIGYFDIYKNGVPQDKLQSLCDELQIKISIETPFNKDKYISHRSVKKPLKHFHYINSSQNHVEVVNQPIRENKGLTRFFKVIQQKKDKVKHNLSTCSFDDLDDVEYTHADLEKIKRELLDKNQYFIFGRNKNGISYIQTIDKIYRVGDKLRDTCREFEKEWNMESYKIDAIKNPDLQKFINKGTHFNGTTDFKELPDISNPSLRHDDMKKAYSQFSTSKYYDGFLGKITDFRRVDNFNEKGYYFIDSLDLSNSNPKFKFYNEKMGWFRNKNIYTDAELRFLRDVGGKFIVKYGAFGTKTRFKFSDDMLNKKHTIFKSNKKKINISYYALWVGKCASMNYNKSFCMYGTREYFNNIRDEHNHIVYDEVYNEATISYPKQQLKNLMHISGQITAYQRLVIMEQLLEMDESKIYRVCVDGIYYDDHQFKLNPVFQDKRDSMTFNNSPTENYLSNVFSNSGLDTEIEGIRMGNEREYYQSLLELGQGGSGKTYSNIRDYGLVDAIYIAPPWKLARATEKEIKLLEDCKIKVSVKHRILNMEFCEKLQEQYKVYIWDEVSQYTEREKEKILKIDGKHIFLGDLGYQLEPVIDEAGLSLIFMLQDDDLCHEVASIKNNSQNPKDKKALCKSCLGYIKRDKTHMKEFYKWCKTEGHFEMNHDNIDNVIVRTIDYRAKDCPKLQQLKIDLRKFIDKGRYSKNRLDIREQAIDHAKKYIKTISRGELQTIYKPTDLILASQHRHNSEYTNLFNTTEKYLVKNNTRDYNNGEIILHRPTEDIKVELTHGFTIHAIQGETIDNPHRLFIDTRNMFSDRMLYTAISRARNINQIFFI
tara:strand:- start:4289 stop:7714 length:3426 start_codon:yes stop_codon:yes gene_type:complete